MDDREKLIELIMSSGQVSGFAGSLATYLIANGVVIQKQGEWELVEYAFNYYAKCTHCNEEYCFDVGWSLADWQKYIHYCPNCGAKMKEVK